MVMDPVSLLLAKYGPAVVLTDVLDCEPFGTDWRDLYHRKPRAVLRPRNTEEVATCVAVCAEAKLPIVPQGGNTSMVAGGVPSRDDSEVVLSLTRLNRVRAINVRDFSMIVEAGVTLKAAQLAAEVEALLFPLSISAEGSATIGGVVATNAGGNNTLRFGNARDLLLGLEVVLPDGGVLNGLRTLRKDNTGYPLKCLFSGSEGTLGIVTAAAFRLARAPRWRETALVGCPTVGAVLELFNRFRDEDEAALYAFEYISGAALELHKAYLPGFRPPLQVDACHYVLVELASTRRRDDLRATFELVLAEAMSLEYVQDAVIAESELHRQTFWSLRENLPESQRCAGKSIKNDVSVPISSIPALLEKTEKMLETRFPTARLSPFGHIGDGNIHLNILLPPDERIEQSELIEPLISAVNEIVFGLDGSFSAEHGIGQLKRSAFAQYRNLHERAVMERIKLALDPQRVLNPGKIFSRP